MKLTRQLRNLILAMAAISLALHAQQTQPPPTAPAQSRLLCLFFDLNTLNAAALTTAQDTAVKFIERQANPADRMTVMTYDSQLNVLQDFTGDRDSLLAAVRMIMPSGATRTIDANTQLQGLQSAISSLASLPDGKVMIYFSSGIPKNSVDNQAQVRAATAAAVRANVSVYPVDSRGLQVNPRQ